MIPFYAKAVLRNPYSHLPLLLPLFALGFRGREEGVALLSLYGLLSLFLPPLVLALSVPLLASREEWGLLGGLGRPERLFLEATFGITLGLLLPLSAGLALAGGVLGLSWTKGAYLWGAGLLLALTFLVVAAWASALTLSEGRAMALGLLLWGVLVLGYDLLLITLYQAFSRYPIDTLLFALALLNPVDLLRVGLLHLLEAPVLLGTGAYLLQRALDGLLLPLLGVYLGLLALGFWGAGWLLGRRER